MEVLYQLTPVMGITLLILSLAHERLWDSLPGSPYFASLPRVLLSVTIIFCFALVAFCMVVAEFALIANTSALTFMVAGTFKEIVTGGCVQGGAGQCGGLWEGVQGVAGGTRRLAAGWGLVHRGRIGCIGLCRHRLVTRI